MGELDTVLRVPFSLPTDPASVEAMTELQQPSNHRFHRRGVGGEQWGPAVLFLADSCRPTDAGSVEAAHSHAVPEGRDQGEPALALFRSRVL
jgi:hypothetical protein